MGMSLDRLHATWTVAWRALKALGLADLLVVGGFLAGLSGIVQRYGWATALMVGGGIAFVAGVLLAIAESRKPRATR